MPEDPSAVQPGTWPHVFQHKISIFSSTGMPLLSVRRPQATGAGALLQGFEVLTVMQLGQHGE